MVRWCGIRVYPTLAGGGSLEQLQPHTLASVVGQIDADPATTVRLDAEIILLVVGLAIIRLSRS